MKKLKLSHTYTPLELANINEELENLINKEELDDKLLRNLIDKRDVVIAQHLKTLQDESRKNFCEAEISVNTTLTNVANGFYRDSLSQLSGLVRGMKVVQKYK